MQVQAGASLQTVVDIRAVTPGGHKCLLRNKAQSAPMQDSATNDCGLNARHLATLSGYTEAACKQELELATTWRPLGGVTRAHHAWLLHSTVLRCNPMKQQISCGDEFVKHGGLTSAPTVPCLEFRTLSCSIFNV